MSAISELNYISPFSSYDFWLLLKENTDHWMKISSLKIVEVKNLTFSSYSNLNLTSQKASILTTNHQINKFDQKFSSAIQRN